jgi:hypothetical protein
MLPDSADAFWLAFVVLLAYECLDKHGAFVLRLTAQSGGWNCRFPIAALRIRDGYLEFYGPLDWLRVEVCVNWLRVQHAELKAAVDHEVDAATSVGADSVSSLQVLRLPVAALASGLLVVLPLSAWVFGVSNALLLAIGVIYASAAWVGWCLVAQGKAFPYARDALRSLAIEIFFCPLFGIGAMRKAARLLLSKSIVDYRYSFAEGEWLRLCGWIDTQIQPLEAYWQDASPSTDGDDLREQWQARLAAARDFYKGACNAAE